MLSNPTIVLGSILWIGLIIFVFIKKERLFFVPLLMIIAGVFSNILVVSLNDNKMPVWLPSYFGDKDNNCSISNTTKLNFLADRFYIGLGIATDKDEDMTLGLLLSIGDLLFYSGFFILIILIIFQLVLYSQKSKPLH